MKIPTVSRCCCCVELRTAGIIIGVLGVIFPLLAFISGDHWINHVLTLVVEVLWLFGIFKEKPKFMIPSLILSAIGTIVLLLSPFFLTIFLKFTSRKMYDELQNAENFWAIYISICVFFYIIAAISIYIMIVCYSVYKLIEEKVSSESNQGTGNAPTASNPPKYEP